MLGVTLKTLQKWDNSGILKAYRTPTNRRYYTHSQYLEYMGNKVPADTAHSENMGKNVIYSRVSSRNQKDDLKNQTAFLRTFCNAKGVITDEVIEEIGSGLNFNRKKWNRLLDQVLKGEIGTVYITHKDRFIRFGFDWFERLCHQFGASIVVVNNESLSPTEEMVQDIISIIHVFSCRIYGLRKYKKLIREDREVFGGKEKEIEETEIEAEI